MTLEYALRIPVEDTYLISLGRATYAFSSYEATIVHLIDKLKPGYLAEYSRHKRGYMAGNVLTKLKEDVIDNAATDFAKLSKDELTVIHDNFQALIIRRNTLIHGHPITAENGEQILAYQGGANKPFPDVHWPQDAVDCFAEDTAIQQIDFVMPAFEKVR